MKFDVTRYGPGGSEVVTVEADSGDAAAEKASKPGMLIRGVFPSAEQDEPKKRGRPAAQGEEV
jgi:hypothetical protein